jgi:(2Fe-2S) ferredoxin
LDGEEELWISSHQGGHRFAANVLVLPTGLQFGRVDPGDAPRVVAEALSGRIELDRYRGRTCYLPAVQAAERVVREVLKLEGTADLALVAEEAPLVRFRGRDGSEYAATVDAVVGPSVPVSCGLEPEPQKAFSARLV